MKPLQVLIVEDMPIAQDILESYVQKMPSLQLAGKCKNALEAYHFLLEHRVDILLLDINLPEISGIEFLRTLTDPPLVIFTTAYAEFAVESYDLNAVDYLLKPVSFERFLKAVHKATALLQSPAKATEPPKTGDKDILFVKTDRKLIQIDLTRLWLVEGYTVYVKLWTDQSPVVVHSTMKNIEAQLAPFPHFIRVNKSYIINMKFVSEVDGNLIRIKDQVIPIGNTYKDQVRKVFDGHKLL